LQSKRLTKMPCLRVDYLCSFQGSLGHAWRLGSMTRHKRRLGRKIRETGSTSCAIRKRPCLIILLSAIIGHWNISFFFLIINSMIYNPNIYSSSAKRPNNNLPLLFPFLCHSRALLLFLSDWVFFLPFLYKNLYKTFLKGIFYFKEDLGIHSTRSLTTCYVFSE